MSRALLTLVTVIAVSVAAWSSGVRAGADDAEIVFDPPMSVNIRQTNGIAARGEMLSINEKDLQLRTVSGKEVRLKLERVRSIKTSNETFEYWPGDESFSDLCARASEVPGATLMGDAPRSGTGRSSQRNAPQRNAPNQDEPEDRGDRRGIDRGKPQPPVPLPSGSDILAKGRPGLVPGLGRGSDGEVKEGTQPSANRSAPRTTVRDEEPDNRDEPADADDTPRPGTTIYLCSSCQEELPLAFRSGDACPHCGKVAVLEEESAESAALVEPAPVKNPFAAGGPATTPAVAAPAAAAPMAAAPPPESSGGMGLADMPLIAKIGIFLGFVIVGWFLLGRR